MIQRLWLVLALTLALSFVSSMSTAQEPDLLRIRISELEERVLLLEAEMGNVSYKVTRLESDVAHIESNVSLMRKSSK